MKKAFYNFYISYFILETICPKHARDSPGYACYVTSGSTEPFKIDSDQNERETRLYLIFYITR